MMQPEMRTREVRLDWTVFLFMFCAEFAFGYFLCVVKYDIPNDALSRVANAYYVFFSRDPHLAAIGFVWNPLPSLAELPLVLLSRLCPLLVSHALAGVILAAVAAAGQAVLILRQFRKHLGSVGWGLAMAGLLAIHPFLFLYGANGMSEMMFSFFLVWCVCAWTDWLASHAVKDLTRAGIALSLAFLTRYEAVAFGMAMALAVTMAAWRHSRNVLAGLETLPPGGHAWGMRSIRREQRWYTTASLLVFLTPSVYAGIIWILSNGIIMKDPLYFFHSAYSNQSQSSVLQSTEEFSSMVGHPLHVMAFMAQRLAVFVLPYLALMVFRWLHGRLWTWSSLTLTLLILSIPSLQFVLLLEGHSYGWLRFFFYPLPLTIAWMPYELANREPAARKAERCEAPASRFQRRRVLYGVALALVTSGSGVCFVMDNARLAPEEYDIIHQRWNLGRMETTREIAQYLDAHAPHSFILMDSFSAFNVIVNTRNPKRLIITSDRDFQAALHNPPAHHVQFMLVPEPDTVFQFDAINLQYPQFYAHGAKWATLVKQFPGWRLYAVRPPAAR
ncbi:hypothetical protein GCM10025857_23230 [Alicyclobacillus contaminans]|uniref:glycosyltransferase family 39 protein n=1 Tax=Alicyclobacillus contaminans TaxID=392016 RepID=UPI00042A8E67|nr:glycosyltransferase family 39 protein [Alicyclobacillus contaminans]GMA50966.1 hypothetical protein GCM10025857_23230 [Alicyclobacillus contaminans]